MTSSPNRPVSINVFDEIQSLCSAYRRQLKKGEQKSIEDYLRDFDESAQKMLFQNLLHIDIEFRRRNGETPQSSDYSKRFPKFARLIRQAFFEDTMMSMDPMQDTPVVDSAQFADPLNQDVSFDSLAHQQAAYAPMEMPAARRIGDYELIRELGRGGMGVVYEAKHLQRQNHVALKTLPTGVDGQEVNAERLHKFRNEFRSLSEINHPNLVGMQSLEVDGNQWFFTMDLIDGTDFLSYVRPSNALDENRLRRSLQQLAKGIVALHRRGIVHRDLKPSNVLVSRDGRVSILDFGLAVELQRTTDMTQTKSGMFAGTPRYAAPEQMFGERTEASDWYAFGTMLYEALAGKPPFVGKDPFQLLRDKQKLDAPVLTENPILPDDLAQIANGLIRREPDERMNAESVGNFLQLDLDTRTSVSVTGSRTSSISVPVEALSFEKVDDEETVLIGREAPLAQLESIKKDFLESRKPKVVWITGLSGEGKTSLVEKFLGPIRKSRNMQVLSGRCYDRESVPFKAVDCIIDPLVTFLRSAIGSDLNSQLPEDIHLLAYLFPMLRRVDAIEKRSSLQSIGIEPEKLRARAFYAFRELLESISQQSPIVFFVDDLQWADADSAQVWNEVITAVNPARALFIGSYRRDEADQSAFLRAWSRLSLQSSRQIETIEIELQPLAPEHCIELAVAKTGADRRVIQRQALQLHADTGGNPYLMDQLIEGFDSSTGEFQRAPLNEVIDRRLARLPPMAAEFLQVIAVFGQPISVSEASKVAGSANSELATVTHMRSERLVRLIAGDEEIVDTYHDKVRETVLHRLSDTEKQRLHLKLAATIEEMEGCSADTYYKQLVASTTAGEFSIAVSPRVYDIAHHFLRAQDPRAFVYQFVAAEQAFQAFAIEESIGMYEQAERLMPSNCCNTLRFRLWLAMGRVYQWKKNVDSAIGAYERASSIAGSASDLARAYAGIADVNLQIGKFDRAVQHYDDALLELGVRRPRTRIGKLLSWTIKSFCVLILPASWQRSPDKNRAAAAKLKFRILDPLVWAVQEKDFIDALDVYARTTISAFQTGEERLISLGHAIAAHIWSSMGLQWIGNLCLKRSARIEAQLHDPSLRGLLIQKRAFGSYWTGRSLESALGFENAIPYSNRSGNFYDVLMSTHMLRHARSYVDTSEAEYQAGASLLEYAIDVGNAQSTCWGYYDSASALARRGDLKNAFIHMAKANFMLNEERFNITNAIRLGTDSYVHLQASDYVGARLMAAGAWQRAVESLVLVDITVLCLPVLIEAIAGPNWTKSISNAGAPKQLNKALRRAWALYPTIPNHQPHLLRVGGRAAMAMGRKRKAIRKFEKAIKLASKKGMKYQRAKCLLDLAAVTEEKRKEKRKENRAEAIQLLKEMESVIPRAESWLLGDQYDEAVVAPELDIEAWEKENGPVSPPSEDAE